MMPGESSRAALEVLRNARPSAAALVAGGCSCDQLHELQETNKAREILRKPYTAQELLSRVREVLRERPSGA